LVKIFWFDIYKALIDIKQDYL